jgi:cytochrome c oxidase cbb3-type subunit 3
MSAMHGALLKTRIAHTRTVLCGFGAAVACFVLAIPSSAQEPVAAKGAEVFQKICGTCHTPQSVLTIRRARAQWQETIDKMVSFGAKATDEEFAAILNYLSEQYGPDAAGGAAVGGRRGGRGGTGAAQPRPLGSGVGANDKHVVDAAAASRGRSAWAAECINCHGTNARGTDNGPNLVRSDLILHDRYGSELGPFLKKGHPRQSGAPSSSLTPVQVAELSHFIHQRVYETLRGSPLFQMHDILTGDAKAGAAYFNGEGGCKACHAVTGDFKGIASRYDPPALLARFLYPGAGSRGRGRGAINPGAKQVTLTVTPPSGEPVTGVPVVFDDFDVSVRDTSGAVHSWTRTPGLKVVKNNPYAAHEALLEKYTDKNMHDLLAFLVTLK